MSSSSQNDGIVNVLIALGPLSQDDVNCSIIEYFSRHLASPKVNAFVFSYCPQSPHTANEKEELSLDAETKRKGCRKAPVSVLDDARLKKKVVDVPGASLEKTLVPEFMPLGGKLRASLFALESGANVNAIEVFEVDPESGFPHAAAAIQGICDGAFAKKVSALPGEPKEEPEPAFFVPRPDYVLMGTHGKSLLERFVVGSVATNVLHNVDVPSIFYRQNVEFKEKPVAGVKTEGEGVSKVRCRDASEGRRRRRRETRSRSTTTTTTKKRCIVGDLWYAIVDRCG